MPAAEPHSRHLFKNDRAPERVVIDAPEQEGADTFLGVRCPLCRWRPTKSDRWACHWSRKTPEPSFVACGTVWNTFSTRGRCPGCGHQWQWTSCHQCHEWSLHEDWYEDTGDDT